MTANTPIARNKTSALARVLDALPKGYTRWTAGTVKPSKAIALASKFHRLFGIGLSPARRLTRKHKGHANALLVLYWPVDAAEVHWLLLATPGSGLEAERWTDVTAKPRLRWLGYELVRHAVRGRPAWTWRRPKAAMAELYALLDEHLRRRQQGALDALVQRVAHQPGFHGVREQSWALFQHARSRGYAAELPHLFFVQKVSHGERLTLNTELEDGLTPA